MKPSHDQGSMPQILYGTAWKEERTADCVQRALAAGFRGIDTACQPKHYDEARVGEGIATFLGSEAGRNLTREHLYLQTKFTPLSGQDPERVPYDPTAAPNLQVEQSVVASLRNLRVQRLDCLVLHSPIRDAHTMDAVWRAMEEATERGQTTTLGISNCYEPEVLRSLYERARVKPRVLQNRFYAETGHDRVVRAYCKSHAIVYQSFWTLTANRDALEHPTVQALAERYERTPAQVFLRYVSQQGIVPLSGTQSDLHMREDLAIFEFALTREESDSISALLRGQ